MTNIVERLFEGSRLEPLAREVFQLFGPRGQAFEIRDNAYIRQIMAYVLTETSNCIDVGAFRHCATYNEAECRIEMYLECRRTQRMQLAGCQFAFEAGERILTEYSYKYSVRSFRQLAASAGFRPRAAWTDAGGLFSVHWLVPADRIAVAARRSELSQG